ncbi:hypothetical protein IF129_08715 [Streptomyces chumphonensis]|uniref:Cellulose synthase n=1 Tax=Streptomyces chumphonensis TaxID=1214925 RepID=A0A927EZK9_9ACTN|nr:hypothetical protein [Streptomyces chumphonensis]MBD3931641.1 hypothetical protein [Streptomyces chumphonensis]
MLTVTVCAALSAAGLAVSFLTAWRRRFVAATRIAAISLVPIGLALSGLLGMFGDVARSIGSWAADLVLDPGVWIGFGVLAVSVVLYVVARVAGGRSARRGRAAEAAGGAPATGPGRSAAPVEGRRPGGSAPSPGGGEDFSDIEEILKKHGI